jgi:hypothetical protein
MKKKEWLCIWSCTWGEKNRWTISMPKRYEENFLEDSFLRNIGANSPWLIFTSVNWSGGDIIHIGIKILEKAEEELDIFLKQFCITNNLELKHK